MVHTRLEAEQAGSVLLAASSYSVAFVFSWQGLALTRVPKVKYLIIIGGAKFQSPTVASKAYANKIACPSLHFIGTLRQWHRRASFHCHAKFVCRLRSSVALVETFGLLLLID